MTSKIEHQALHANFAPDALLAFKQAFLQRMSDFKAFDDPGQTYPAEERRYKDELLARFREKTLPVLRDAGAPGSAVCAALYDLFMRERLPTSGQPQNLLSWRTAEHLNKIPAAEAEPAAALIRALLFGDDEIFARIDAFVEGYRLLLQTLKNAELPSGGPADLRSLATLLLMLHNPTEYIFVRLSPFNTVARALTGNPLFKQGTRPSGSEYRATLAFVSALRATFEAWGWVPQDMIDVQSFIWVVAQAPNEAVCAATSPAPVATGDRQRTWIFQSNPKFYDLPGALGELRELDWMIKQYAREIRARDRVYLWEGGAEAGLVAIAEVLGDPVKRQEDGIDKAFVRDTAKFNSDQLQVRLRVRQVLPDRISRATLQAHPLLRELTILRAPQGTNFAVSPEQQAALDALVSSTNTEPYQVPDFPAVVTHIAEQGLRLNETLVRRYHLALQMRGFVILSGVSGTGKTWLTQAYAQAIGAAYQLVPVAPNWTTNEDLLGYFNPLDKAYYDTAFSHFLRQAANAYQTARDAGIAARPYHLVLDEMNLARVEYYFAKFLSAMEVRARQDEATLGLAPGETVPLTPNLKFIGTVNVDETTHGFADKVYDRAQLIELECPRELLAEHLGEAIYAMRVIEIWDAVHPVAPFAFRTLDEISAYVAAAERLGVSWEAALDEQLVQKILPKLKGADSQVEHALDGLDGLTRDMPLSQHKIALMRQRYQQHGFTAFF